MRRAALPLLAALALAAPACAQPKSSADAALISAAAKARYVLLGESTHGTHEFYRERAELTEILVRDHGVRALAIEGDWSGAERVNRYVRGVGADRTAEEALKGFDSFPQWMWRNAEFRDLVERLRVLNQGRSPENQVGVYGVDVYDVADAAEAVTAHLATADAEAAEQARRHYRCFARFRRAMDGYGRAIAQGARSCEPAARAVLAQVQGLPAPSAGQREARYAALRAAAVVAAGEEYFRVQQATGYSWNARDRRMAAAIQDVSRHVDAPVVVWAHNTHVGDARETSLRRRGEISLGQLLRDTREALLVGFLTYEGEVMAADAWDQPPRVFRLRPALDGSHEAALAAEGPGRIVRLTIGHEPGPERLQRAVGVVYAPRQERQAHYIGARLERQFDAVIFIRTTRAVGYLGRR